MTDDLTEEFESSVLAELSWRGFIKQLTHEEIDEALSGDPVTLYCGFDPSGPSLHVGHLMGLVTLAHFRRHGHTPMALVGGATGMIGDPSGRDEERNLLSDDEIAHNIAGLSGQMRTILDRALTMHADEVEVDVADADEIPIVNNADWMKPWSFIEFLRDVGKHFRVNHMIAKDSVRDRLENREQGISYTEFSYMLIQAYDFFHLFEERDCALQVGGSDQWGNITAGTDLIRRKANASAFGLTFPLLTDAEGNKFGKSTGGAIWLDPERTSPYAFYQYWLNQQDADMPKLLKAFTFLPKERVDALCGTIERGENRGQVQREFAYQMTWLAHGKEDADAVVRASKVLFGGEVEGLTDKALLPILDEVPSTEIARSTLEEGVDIIDLLVDVELQKSKGQARRLLKQGGVYVNNNRVEDREYTVDTGDIATETMLLLRAGKKSYHVIRVV